jgi:serine/threonine-protein kinase
VIPQEEETRVGSLVSGKYRIELRLGAGAVGEVFRARNVLLGRDVAIKFLRREHLQNEELVERFLREAQAVSRVRHPHVVDVLDVGVEDDAPYIVQELLLGEDLCSHVTRKGGKLAPRAALERLLPAVDGVAHAHERGVVHRDLKPENIFLARTDDGVVPKVLDFGISKVKTGNLRATVTGSVFGTPGYMSPEQVRSFADADARADVWSLGVILYELVAGRIPFESQEANALMVEVCTRPPFPFAQAAPEAPPGLVAIVNRCLAQDPAERYADAGALAAALRGLEDAPERITRLQFVKASMPPPRQEDEGRISLDQEPLAMLHALPSRASIVQPVRVSIIAERPWELDLSAAARQLDAQSTLSGNALVVSHPPRPKPRSKRLPAVIVGLALAGVAVFAAVGSQRTPPEAPAPRRPLRRALPPPTPVHVPPPPSPVAAPDAAVVAPAHPAVVAPSPTPTPTPMPTPNPRRSSSSASVRAETPTPDMPARPEAVTASPSAPASTSALEAAVRRASALNMSQVATCIERARSNDATLAGRLSVRLTIAPDGAIREATPVAARPMAPLARCLARAMVTWRVSATGASTDTVLTWPFELVAR